MGYTVSPALRLSAAVLISSIAALPIYLIAILWLGDSADVSTLASVLMMALMLTMGCVAIVGVPVHALLAFLNLRRAWTYAIAGFGVPLAFVFAARPFGDDATLGLMAQAGLAGIFGACVALVFWKLAVSSG
jgi:hypothetical protein